MAQARHSNIIVVGRAHNIYLMPNNLIERLLVECGRPMVIAADKSGWDNRVGWKESSEAARALAGAMPLLHGLEEWS